MTSLAFDQGYDLYKAVPDLSFAEVLRRGSRTFAKVADQIAFHQGYCTARLQRIQQEPDTYAKKRSKWPGATTVGEPRPSRPIARSPPVHHRSSSDISGTFLG